jgi:hypothetical protein
MPLVFIVIIVVFSVVIGAVAKALNNWNQQVAARTRPMAKSGNNGGGSVRQNKSDMDRFLAEIDRLRKKSADAPAAASKKAPPVAPVVQPAKKPDRPRARVIAELAEPAKPDTGFAQQILAPVTGPKAGDIPVATVVTPPSGTGAPATRVTRLGQRPRPAPKTPLAKNLTALLNSGQGLAIAIVLQEILGPRKGAKG